MWTVRAPRPSIVSATSSPSRSGPSPRGLVPVAIRSPGSSVVTREAAAISATVVKSCDASGLVPFLPGAWHAPPYASEAIFEPVANANTAQVWSGGRRGAWACQP